MDNDWTTRHNSLLTLSLVLQATGDIIDDDSAPNGMSWDYANEKFDMKVPERILVVGQDQHVGKFVNKTNKLIPLLNRNLASILIFRFVWNAEDYRKS